MFGGSPSRGEHEALAEIVMQQSQVIILLQEQAEATSDMLSQLGDFAAQIRSESLVLKGMMGGIIAEIASRRDEPYEELNDILGRIRFTANEFSLDSTTLEDHAASARDFICEYAQDYLRRGYQP